MEEYLDDKSVSELLKESSKNPTNLRATVKKIEQEYLAKWRVEDASKDEEEVLRELWLKLVSFSMSEANLELAILMAAKLKLVQLALTLTSTLRQDNSLSYSMALAYVTNYFRAQSKEKSFDFLESSSWLNLAEFEHLLEFCVTSCEWNRAFDIVRRQLPRNEPQPFAKLIYYRRAQFEEAEEEFEKALSDYEAAGAQPIDIIRVFMKQHLGASVELLRDYCSTHENLQTFYRQFTCLFDDNNQEDGLVLLDSIRLFIDDEDGPMDNNRTNKWLDWKRVEFLRTVVSSLNTESITRLVRESIKSRQIYDLNKASSIHLILNEMSSFMDELPQCKSATECISIYTSLPDRSFFLAYFFTSNYFLSKPRHQRLPVAKKGVENASFMACIRLGLVNESLEELVMDRQVEERTLEEAINYLESCCQSDNTQTNNNLDYLDAELKDTTLTKLEPFLGDSLPLTTAVISIVILSTTLYLLKLQHDPQTNNNTSLAKLESMFRKLSKYLCEYDFNASNTFVSCTSRLMVVVKNQLDAILDSEIIRQTLGQLVERGAAKSLMQGRYRSAAKLYQLVEDNINAVKSLMRVGDVELVIKYSLLVRDVTVNRLTVNYLKHLNVDSSTIEDFIANSREAV